MCLRISAPTLSGLQEKRQKQTDTAKKMRRTMKRTQENEITLSIGHTDGILHHGLF